MPISGAERQRRYRDRHREGLAHITLDVRSAVRDRLDRLAWHFGWNVTQLVEELAERAERAVEAELSDPARAKNSLPPAGAGPDRGDLLYRFHIHARPQLVLVRIVSTM